MLSVTVQHALRALSVLAGLPHSEYLLGKELAKRAGIPANYLSKILWVLGGAGFINAARGNGGGYRLHKPPTEIRLAEIVQLFDHNRNTGFCFLDDQRACSHAHPCSAHRVWHELDAALRHFLETTTVADIAKESPPV
jgi:Rrf2 family iron-sulfur cluster assembly transcriptional regulator